MGKINDSEWITAADRAKMSRVAALAKGREVARQHAHLISNASLRQRGRVQCDRCGGSGIHVSPNMTGRVCALCCGTGWLEKPPIPKIQPSKGFGMRAKQKRSVELFEDAR